MRAIMHEEQCHVITGTASARRMFLENVCAESTQLTWICADYGFVGLPSLVSMMLQTVTACGNRQNACTLYTEPRIQPYADKPVKKASSQVSAV